MLAGFAGAENHRAVRGSDVGEAALRFLCVKLGIWRDSIYEDAWMLLMLAVLA